MKPFCPRCGYDHLLDTPILLNDFAMMGPIAPLTWRGEPLRLTASEQQVCWALMKSYPDAVRVDVLLDRLGSEATSNAMHVYVCRIRKKLAAMGAPNPIRSASLHGVYRAYSWSLDNRDICG